MTDAEEEAEADAKESINSRAGAAMSRILWVLPITLVFACATHSSFLPDEGVYEGEWNSIPKYAIHVTGTGIERRIEHRRSCGGCPDYSEHLIATDAGITDAQTNSLLLPAQPEVGMRWLVVGNEQDRCFLERRVVSVSRNLVVVEKIAVCDGQHLQQSVLATWEVRRGCIREDFTGGAWRTMTMKDAGVDGEFAPCVRPQGVVPSSDGGAVARQQPGCAQASL